MVMPSDKIKNQFSVDITCKDGKVHHLQANTMEVHVCSVFATAPSGSLFPNTEMLRLIIWCFPTVVTIGAILLDEWFVELEELLPWN